MTNTKTILITGATGQQGGAVAKELLAKGGFKIRAMTRKPDGAPAQALAKAGAEIVVGDLNDAASLDKALDGAWGVWAVQNTWEAGVEAEEAQGNRIAHRAREKGVSHFVYSSVGSADRKTGIPHFDNKFRVEETVRGLNFASHVILRPVFFMENMVSGWFLNGDTIATAMKPNRKLQMVAVQDIGKYGALAFTKSAELNRAEIDLAGDELTIPEATAIVSEFKKTPIKFVELPIDVIRKNSEDFALMLEWFGEVGYDADIAGNQNKYGIKSLTFREWAAKALRA
jgi:uncharacterized protein YbjT (DUF2867 family)